MGRLRRKNSSTGNFNGMKGCLPVQCCIPLLGHSACNICLSLEAFRASLFLLKSQCCKSECVSLAWKRHSVRQHILTAVKIFKSLVQKYKCFEDHCTESSALQEQNSSQADKCYTFMQHSLFTNVLKVTTATCLKLLPVCHGNLSGNSGFYTPTVISIPDRMRVLFQLCKDDSQDILSSYF